MTAIYLTGAPTERARLLGFKRALEELGHEVTSTWLRDDRIHAADREQRGLWAATDFADITACDVVLLAAVGANSSAWVELGVGLAGGKRIIVVGPPLNDFCCLPDVENFMFWPDAVNALGLGVPERTTRLRDMQLEVWSADAAEARQALSFVDGWLSPQLDPEAQVRPVVESALERTTRLKLSIDAARRAEFAARVLRAPAPVGATDVDLDELRRQGEELRDAIGMLR